MLYEDYEAFCSKQQKPVTRENEKKNDLNFIFGICKSIVTFVKIQISENLTNTDPTWGRL